MFLLVNSWPTVPIKYPKPPITMPCKFDQDPNRCQVITFRTLAPGEVEFTVSAHDEVWDENCCWGTASDTGPEVAVITGLWWIFMPFVRE